MIREHYIPIADSEAWATALSGLPHSVAHTWGYCRAIWSSSNAPTFLYSWERNGARWVCPLCERRFAGSVDVVTPYGCAGFAGVGAPQGLLDDWRAFARQRGYVSGYIGVNPIFAGWVSQDVDAVPEKTIYLIDLRLSEAELFGRLSNNRKRQFRGWESRTGQKITTNRRLVTDFFVEHYGRFMDRKSAPAVYRLSPDSIRSLCRLSEVLLFGAGDGGRIEAAAMVGLTPFSGDYLFGLSVPGGARFSAPLLWTAAHALKARDIPVLNLGGGVREGDNLADFKRRFGGDELPLLALRQVYDRGAYDALCQQVGADASVAAGFFPPYHEPR